jgi:hypothetical protein
METKLNGGVSALPRAAVAFLSRYNGLAFVIASQLQSGRFVGSPILLLSRPSKCRARPARSWFTHSDCL